MHIRASTIEVGRSPSLKEAVSAPMRFPRSSSSTSKTTADAQDIAPELTVRDRMTAATFGSFFVAACVTPLEVIKVKMQTTQPVTTQRLNHISKCFVVCGNGITEHNILCEKFGTASKCEKPVTISAYNIARFVVKTDGIRGLYAGLGPTLMMAIPSNVLYFTGYEMLRGHKDVQNLFGGWAPMVCGSAARVLASSCCAPLELVRTRMALTNSSMLDAMKGLRQDKTCVRASFRGLFPTLLRDAPFSAIYWFLLERWTPTAREFTGGSIMGTFGAGVASGVVASVLTHPIDVIKTQHQTHEILDVGRSAEHSFSISGTIQKVMRAEGVRGLFSGIIPRTMKVGPACGIMIGVYEATKSQVAASHQSR